MGLEDGRNEIEIRFTKAARILSNKIFEDIKFPSGEVIDHETERRELTNNGALLLRHLAHARLIDMGEIREYVAKG